MAETPSQIGPYEITREIGRGGMGVVYLARDTKLDRDVAIKALPAEFAQDADRLSRFEREARTLAQLNHPNIATVFGLEIVDSRHYLILEFLEGRTLGEMVRSGRMSWKQTARIASDVAEALAAAHAKGVVHRDIKPDNVIVTNDGQVKVLDFGLARTDVPVEGDASDAPTNVPSTEPGLVLGTPGYLSPEQVRGQTSDARSDIFSFGCVLHEMLSGESAFARETKADSFAATLREEPQDLSTTNIGVPSELCRITQRCLEKEPNDRFQSARDLAYAIRGTVSDGGSGAEAAAAKSYHGRWFVASVAMLGLFLGVLAVVYFTWPPREAGDRIEALAILPFANESGDENLTFLADGIPEGIINRLKSIDGLHVVPRNTSFLFRGRESELGEVGNALGVQAILTGRVMRRDERIVISASLEDVVNGTQLWGPSRFDEPLDKPLEVESRLANQIAEALRLELTVEQRELIAVSGTDNSQAYRAYMDGHFLRRQETAAGVRRSIEAFELAIRLDESFAGAHASLAGVYGDAAAWSVLSPDEAIPKHRAALNRALELDSENATAIAERAAAAMEFDWDWDSAEQDLRRAIDIDPSHAFAHHRLGHVLAMRGQFDQALVEFERAAELEPLTPVHLECLGANLIQLDRLDDAEQVLLDALKWEPDFAPAHRYLAWIDERRGNIPDALQHAQDAVDASDRAVLDVSLLGYIAGISGDAQTADRLLEELLDRKSDSYIAPVEIARIHVGLAEIDEALDVLNNAVESRDATWLSGKLFEVGFESLRGHPRFDALFPKMNLEAPKPLPGQASIATGPPRLAVLPFDIVGDNADAEFLADEIPASIIDSMSALSGLTVVPRSTAFQHRGSTGGAAAIGRALEADFVLTGVVSSRGGALRIRAELVDVAADTQPWSDWFDESLDDALYVDAEFPHRIAEALRVEITGEERAALERRRPENSAALTACMEARYWWSLRTPEGLRRAVELFQEAIGRDPDYALAHAELGNAYLMQAVYSHPPVEVMPKAYEALQRAIELDPTLPEPYAGLGFYHLSYQWDAAAAEASLKRALEVDPDSVLANHWYASFLRSRARWDEARQFIKRAVELDPGNFIVRHEHGVVVFTECDFQLAEGLFERVLEMAPTFQLTLGAQGVAKYLLGDRDDGIELMRQSVTGDGACAYQLGLLGAFLAYSGRRAEALEELERLNDLSHVRYVPPIAFACVYAGLGDTDRMFEMLDRCIEERAFIIPWVHVVPEFSPYLEDPKFEAFHRRHGIPVPADDCADLDLESPRPTIAVLPFELRGADDAAAFLADEVPASVLDALSEISFLHVIPRSSSFRHRDSAQTIQQIGEALEADFVLTGQIVPRGEELRIRAELVSVRTNREVFTDRIDQSSNDTLAAETTITRGILDSLLLPTTAEERQLLARRRPVHPAAHEAYIEGRFWWNKRTVDGLHRAAELLQRAIDTDPDYALAHAALAQTYVIQADYGNAEELLNRTRDAARRAIELDPQLASAHAALGLHAMQMRDHAAAESSYCRAIEADPNYASAHQWLGLYHLELGMIDDAAALFETARRLEPDSVVINNNLAWIEYCGRDFERAAILARQVLEMDSSFPSALFLLATAQIELEQSEQALETIDRIRTEVAHDTGDGLLTIALARMGHRVEAVEALRRFEQTGETQSIDQIDLALAYAELGHFDTAFELLFANLETSSKLPSFLKTSPYWDPLRHDPRFIELMQAMNLEPEPGDVLAEPIGIHVPVIGVLPFEMPGADADAAYLAEELPASIIDSLSGLSRVHTIPRSSAFRHRDSTDTIPQIGEALGADFVVTGQIIPRGDELRIRAELVSVRTNRQVWSDQLVRTFSDTLAAEIVLTERIIKTLMLPVSETEAQQLARRRPVNPDAHDAYLKGLSLWHRPTPANLPMALEHLQRAVELEPGYALAHQAMADTYNSLAIYIGPPMQFVPNAIDAADRAIALNPTLADAYATRAWNNMTWHHDWDAAERDLKESLRLDPRSQIGHLVYAWWHFGRGNLEEALLAIESARRIDHGSSIYNADLGLMLLYSGRYDEAQIALQEALELDQQNAKALASMVLLDSLKGRFEQAIDRARTMQEADLLLPIFYDEIGEALARGGHLEEARDYLNSLLNRRKDEYIPAEGIAALYRDLEDSDAALDWLETSFKERSPILFIELTTDEWLGVRSSPRFRDLCQRVGVDPAWVAPGVLRSGTDSN